MHFGSQYHKDPRKVEQYFAQWLRSIRDEARMLILVGDIFDYWFEYKYVVPRGCTRIIGTLAEMSDNGVEIHLFTGNHDVWMFDYLETEIGCTIHRAPTTFEIDGYRFFIAHGDEFETNNKKFQFIRHIFHSRLCQVLYASIHPRWTVGFAHAWSLHSRKKGLKKYKVRQIPNDPKTEYLVQFTQQYLRNHSSKTPDFFIFGHRHILLDHPLDAARVVILGDWISFFSYAEWDGTALSLNQLPTPYTT